MLGRRMLRASDRRSGVQGVGFWMSKGQGGSRSILFAQLIPQSSPPMMRVQRPKIGKSCRNMALSELRVKMQPVLDTDVARSAWEKLYKVRDPSRAPPDDPCQRARVCGEKTLASALSTVPRRLPS